MPPLIDLTGQRFGRLVVVKRVGKNKWNNYKWLCKYDCGKEITPTTSNLKGGTTQSCGCFKKEGNVIKHGHSTQEKRSQTYYSWSNMIQRCTNPNHKQWKDYGGRGIKVCKRWLKFENFLIDMGERPLGLTLERKNNNRNYCKSNCRWATRKEQNRNSRNNRLETYNGKTQCIAAWAEEYNICPCVLRGRLDIGWSMEKALTTSVRKYKKGKRKKWTPQH